MADVANALNAISPKNSDSGNVVPSESPDSVILSPNIKEAMDRILPKSASQLFQQGLMFDQHGPQESLSPFVGSSNVSPSVMPSVNETAYSSKTVAHFTTASCNKPSLYSSDQSYDSSLTSSFTSFNGSARDSNEPKKKISKIRISKADLEIITSASEIFQDSMSSDPEDMTRCFSSVREKRKHKKKRKRDMPSLEQGNALTQEYDSISEDNSENSVASKGNCESNLKSFTQPLVSRNNEMSESCDSKLHKNNVNYINDIQSNMENNNALSNNGFNNECAIGNEDVSNISASSYKENVSYQRKPSGQALPKTKRLQFNVVLQKSKIRHTFPPCYVVLNRTFFPSEEVLVNHHECLDTPLPLSTRVQHLSKLCKDGLVDCKKKNQKGVTIVDEPIYKNIFEENMLDNPVNDDFQNCFGRRSLRKRDKNISYVEPSEDDIMEIFSKKRSSSKTKDSGSDCSLSRDSKDLNGDRLSTQVKGSGNDSDSTSELKKKKTQEKNKDNEKLLQAQEKTKEKLSKAQEKVKENDESSRNQEKIKESDILPSRNQEKIKESDILPSRNQEKIKESDILPSKNIPEKAAGIKEIIVFPSAPIVNRPDFRIMTPQNASINTDKVQEKKKKKSSASKKSKLVSSEANNGPQFPVPLQPHISVLPPPTQFGLFPTLSPASVPVFPLNSSTLPPSVAGVGSPPVNSTLVSTLPKTLLCPNTQSPGLQKPPQFCVMKVDGKDVLLQLVPNATGTSMLMPGGKKVILQDSSLAHLPPPPPLISPPLRSSTQLTTQTVAVPLTTHQVQSKTVSTAAFANLLSLPLLSRNPSSASSTNTPSMPMSGLPVITFSSVPGFTSTITTRPTMTPAALLPQPLPLITTTTTSMFQTPVVATTSSPVRIVSQTSATATSLAVTMAARSSKTVRQTLADIRTVIRPGLRATVPNQTYRIFLPGCVSNGTPGRFATIGSIANNSPLTRLCASSDLLPQRKRSVETELTPEQKEAKRRKLEKKYPLPPGVVIKTEPLESMPTTTQTISRSLLSPNIQLVSSIRRPGTTVRIIAPAIASALAPRGLSTNSNVIYHRFVIPSSGTITPVVTTSASQSTATHTTSTLTSTTHGSTQPTSSVLVSSSKSAHPSPAIWSPASLLTKGPSEEETWSGVSTEEATRSSVSTDPSISVSQARLPSERQLTTETLEEFEKTLTKLRDMVRNQEALGLKGERLKKLKDILLMKENEFESMRKKLEEEADLSKLQSAVDNNDSSAAATDILGTETEPFVID